MSTIDDFVKSTENAEQMQSMNQIKLTEAYVKAAKKHLSTDNGELLDYSRLDDLNVRINMKNDLIGNIRKDAKSFYATNLKSTNSIDSMKIDALMELYSGMNTLMINKMITENKAKFTLDQFGATAQKAYAPVMQRWINSAGGNLEKSDIPELMNYAGISDAVDTNLMQIDQATSLYMLANQHKKDNDGIAPTAGMLKNYFKQQQGEVPAYLK